MCTSNVKALFNFIVHIVGFDYSSDTLLYLWHHDGNLTHWFLVTHNCFTCDHHSQSTQWGLVTHMCHLTGASLVQVWLIICSMPSQYLNQCWIIISKLQWYLNQIYISFHVSCFKKMHLKKFSHFTQASMCQYMVGCHMKDDEHQTWNDLHHKTSKVLP